MTSNFLIFGILMASCSLALASDPSPLQDFCVADNTSKVFVNGVLTCTSSSSDVEDGGKSLAARRKQLPSAVEANRGGGGSS
ncbi:hypothetical protein L2E82_37445 [Cichorium intybus]|uniref:Uncharacterized protein n=1 Tax=Cichorium intybus TaxID=13427 RepID=A0ACB9AF96_CICIN|nr:hypothetical protein L2E82_37445 [Cichorium intybus]